jgi:hypothetical protein
MQSFIEMKTAGVATKLNGPLVTGGEVWACAIPN